MNLEPAMLLPHPGKCGSFHPLQAPSPRSDRSRGMAKPEERGHCFVENGRIACELQFRTTSSTSSGMAIMEVS